jgi:hypothetical protein
VAQYLHWVFYLCGKEMGQGKKKTYAKEIEAAYYALSRFISTFDYVIRYKDEDGNFHTITPNPNCVLSSLLSKNGFLKPHAITKSDFQNHFNRSVILFYKSDPNSKLTTGYGKNDKDALALSFSAELQITTRKKTDPEYYVLLIGIDIDCHNGEWHVREVEELIKKYLPNTYWEDSTNGNGRHGYLKIKFLRKSFDVLEEICSSLEKLFKKLNELKDLYGYEAPIDKPAGLPYKLKLVDANPYEKNWTTLVYRPGKEDKFLGRFVNPKSKIWNDYVSYLKNNTVRYIPEECYRRPGKLIEHLPLDDIRASLSRFLVENSISFRPPTKNDKYYEIIYRQAFKLPMFGATPSDDGDVLPDMDCIKQFHFLPYYTSSDLYGVYNQILEDIQVLKRSSSPYLYYSGDYHLSSGSLDIDKHVGISPSSSDLYVDIYSIPIPMKGEKKSSYTQKNRITETVEISPTKKGEKTLCNNCVCTNTQNGEENNKANSPEEEEVIVDYADTIDWSYFVKNQEDFEIGEFWDNYRQNRKTKSSSRYEEMLNEVKTEDNTMKRTSKFVRLYINRLGRIPTTDEAEEEYVTRGLNRNSERSTINRRNRIKGSIDYYSKEYDDNYTGFKLNWSEEKTEVLGLMKLYLPEDLIYKQGKKTKSISPEEIGFIYHVIRRMEDSEQHVILRNSLSYSQADELFLAEFGKKCGRHKFPGIIKILLSCGLIKKSGNYKVGLRGNCYVTRRNL